MLARLIYASETAGDLNAQLIAGLLEEARANNNRRDLTGLLLFDHHHFMQVLEGDREVLNELYGKLQRDSRHKHVVLLNFEDIPHRQFGSWAMGYAAVNATTAHILLRHGVSRRFEPHSFAGTRALHILLEMSRLLAPEVSCSD